MTRAAIASIHRYAPHQNLTHGPDSHRMDVVDAKTTEDLIHYGAIESAYSMDSARCNSPPPTREKGVFCRWAHGPPWSAPRCIGVRC
jgi:hypothetical protein